MKIIGRHTLSILMVLGIASPVFGDGDNGGINLGGRTFLITAEFIFVAPIGIPQQVGDTLQNCYTFQDDTNPEDGLNSGIWNDPLFPDPGPPVPGTWIQHTANPTMRYTAFASTENGISLIQNGWLYPVFAQRSVRLKAFSTISVPDVGPVVAIFSKGYQVDECPLDLP